MNNSNQELTASVIIPVYNKERYIERCIQSLKNQTISSSMFEAIFIDDGSIDRSAQIITNYQNNNSWIKLITKENGGVSSARNAGIKQAQGKYIFFLDPDDYLGPETIKNVSELFDSIQSEVDLVTYPIISVTKKKLIKNHFRYDVLTKTGVYDLRKEENAFICQTTINVCVKNKYSHNHLFDYMPDNGVIIHEDIKYNCDILLNKMKIGYCQDAQYYWIKNQQSVTNNYMKPYYLFDNTMALFEHYFNCFKDSVPRYFQALLLNEFGYKMRSHIFLPVHLSGIAYSQAIERFAKLLDKVDDTLIITHPNISNYHRYLLFRIKERSKLFGIVSNNNLILQNRSKEIVFTSTNVEMIILRMICRNGKLTILGLLKSPFFYDYEGPIKFRSKSIPENVNNSIVYHDIEIEESSYSYSGQQVKIERVYSFRYIYDLSHSERLTFELFVNDMKIPLVWSCWGREKPAYFLRNTRIVDYWKIQLDDSKKCINITKYQNDREINRAEKQFEAHVPQLKTRIDRSFVRLQRKIFKRYKKTVWIYTDSIGKTDNAWLQFIHDSHINDGVLRYYANNGAKIVDKHGRFGKVINFGSRKHKLLFCNAEKVICSDTSFKCFCPMPIKGYRCFSDLFNAELIYTQHGVLWAHLPWFYSYDQILFDKEVISSKFERNNLIENYYFKLTDLIESGMPRYDYFDLQNKSKRKILFCPSWRSYLIGPLTKNGRETLDDKFLSSKYYEEISYLINNEKLIRLLKENNFMLEMKLHPLFEPYKKYFSTYSERVTLISGKVNEADYDMVITDYSSYSFDFVYLQRAIVYFIPDADLFFGGINHYKRLDIDIHDAFGPFVDNANDLLSVIEKYFNNNCKLDEKYRERMNKFFFYYDNKNCNRLYEALKCGD